jgi:predicted enzyme related to lactoylglutathione lyase
MFESTKAFSGFAVDGMSRAMQFYANTLGVKVTEEHGMLGLLQEK